MGTPASFKSFATLAARAATPAERLGGAYEPEPPDPAPGADRVPARLAFWLRKAAGGDAGYLARWLEWEGLDAAAVRRALGPVRLKDSEPLPPWAVLWGELTAGTWGAPLETVPGPAPVPFQELLAPLARAARCRLEAGTPGPDRLTQAAWADLERGLLERLLKAAGPTLQAEFSRFREPWVSTLDLAMAGAAGAPPPGTGIYRAFLREQCREGGSPGAFRAYPALARVLAQLAGHWISAWTEALARLEAHAGQLRDRFFDGADPGPVAAIRTGAGDSHNQGRATAILRFQDGSRLVYKPVPAGVDRAWYRLLDWIAARGGPLLPRSPRHLDGPGHGWTEFVEAAPCPDPEALRRYFLRCGALLCLVQLLGGGDCHHENLIAAGEHPILLDLETVMTPELWLPPDPERLPATRPELPALALQTGLLPRWIEAEGHVVDISGFASVASRSYQDPCWSHPGTDLMDLGSEIRQVPAGPNRPRTAAGPAPADVAAIEAGYRRMHRFLRQQRGALGAEDGPLAAFRGQPVRVLARPTHIYRRLLEKAWEPAALRDGADLALQLGVLRAAYRQHRARPRQWPMAAAEAAALAGGDTPYFAMAADGRDLLDGAGGLLVADAAARSCLEAARARLAALDGRGLALQLRVIRASFLLEGAVPVPGPARVQAPPVAAAAAPEVDFLAEAVAAAEQLQRLAVTDSAGGRHWLTRQALGGEPVRLGLRYTSLDLYAGNLGIGLFLAAAAQAAGREDFGRLARSAFRPAERALGVPAGLMAFPGPHGLAGLGGALYALVQAARCLGDGALLAQAARGAALVTPEVIAQDTAFAVMDGCAGTLLGLLALWRAGGPPTALDQAVQCGRHLLQGRIPARGHRAWPFPQGEPLAGYSHGAAGIAAALARLYQATGEAAFLDAARAGVAYEQALFAPAAGDWPDLRPQIPEAHRFAMASWCHGGPGIALGRLAGLAVLDDPGVRADLAAGLAGCRPGPRQVLCCGNLGRADILLEAGRVLGRPDLCARARALAAAAHAGGGRPQAWSLGEPHPVACPDLFQGLAGLGYGFLRMARPDAVPCVPGFGEPRAGAPPLPPS